MAQDNENKLKGAQSRQKSISRLWMSVLMLLGILAIFGAVVWKHVSPESKKELLILQIGQSMAAAGAHPADGSVAQPTNSLADLVTKLIAESNQQEGLALAVDLVRDLGIALVISVIATVVIPKYTSDLVREHVADDVLKLIPEKIYTQVDDNVFRSDVYRRNWEVHIKANAQQVDKGIAIINISHFYYLENLTDHGILKEISGGIDLDVPLPDQGIPKFKSIEIYDERNPELVREKHASALLAKQSEPTYTEGNLTFTRNNQEISFAAQVPILPGEKVTVKYEVERAIRVPGDFVLNTPVPADGIKIILNVDGFKLGIFPLHPNPAALLQTQPDTWRFHAGILPWQGFRFTSGVSS